MYLIDSDVLIDFLKGKKEAVKILGKIKPNQRSTSIICVGEILEGLTDNKKEQFQKLLNIINIYNVDIKVVVIFAEIRKELRKNGNLIDNFDLLIAATCMAYNLILITNNLKHFVRIKGLKILR